MFSTTACVDVNQLPWVNRGACAVGVTSSVTGQLPKARISLQGLVLASGRRGSDAQWGREESTSPEWQQETVHSPQRAGVSGPLPDTEQACGVPLSHLRCPQGRSVWTQADQQEEPRSSGLEWKTTLQGEQWLKRQSRKIRIF